MGVYRNNGKENGNYYNGSHTVQGLFSPRPRHSSHPCTLKLPVLVYMANTAHMGGCQKIMVPFWVP